MSLCTVRYMFVCRLSSYVCMSAVIMHLHLFQVMSLLDSANEPVSDLTYFECLESVMEKSKVSRSLWPSISISRCVWPGLGILTCVWPSFRISTCVWPTCSFGIWTCVWHSFLSRLRRISRRVLVPKWWVWPSKWESVNRYACTDVYWIDIFIVQYECLWL